MTEQQAIALCLKKRNPKGFEILFRQFRYEAFHHAYGLLGNKDDAMDACQEAFRKAFSGIIKLKKLDAFYPWFYRILKNHCINILQKRATHKKNSMRLELEIEHQITAKSVEETIKVTEQRQNFYTCLQRLSPRDREILVLKYTENATYEKISHILHIPRGTVMSRLYNARKAFRNEIERKGLIQ